MRKKASIRQEQLLELSNKLNVEFKDIKLLDMALTHTSYAHEAKTKPKPIHNERLEFLGDSVLGMAVCSYIYTKFPKMPEGDMTKLKAKVVCETALAEYARKFDVGKYLLLGKGEDVSGGRMRNSILADTMEAIIGAYYLDQGWSKADKLILFLTKKEINSSLIKEDVYDYKTALQEIVQRDNTSVVSYKLLAESGPAHNKFFKMAVLIDNKIIANGDGHSKKEAEQIAAKKAMKSIGELK